MESCIEAKTTGIELHQIHSFYELLDVTEKI